ncbi:HAMP domain-containing sensor histidine kinase [Lentilactobacillus kosonis]|uniref:Signal transduction histidine-protein kinase ArlS n=1 Tax=Lentilactobacillus kosonis TaxID=2810561 RepID=A0A401FKJ9_9LACO|nr:HAMP domain-containing histidine kinase [Lentilactobacillus kosonis]GAY72857.1 two-component system histidine kinase [Lentilactobacillus kosonis]
MIEETSPKKRRISLTIKWSFFTSIGVFIILLVFSMLIYNRFTNVLIQQERGYINDTLMTVSGRLANFDSPINQKNANSVLRPDIDDKSNNNVPIDRQTHQSIYSDSLFVNLSRDSMVVNVYDNNKRLLFESRESNFKFKRTDTKSIALTRENGSQVLVGRMPVQSKKNGSLVGYIQVTDTLANYHQTVRKLVAIMAILLVLSVLIAVIVSYILAAELLKPMKEIRNTISEIKENPDSDERVPELHTNDEIADLGNLFNSMLDQTQRYMNQQSQFVEDVSHELRTPVAVIQGHMEMLLRWGKDDPQVLDESLKASLQETKRMQSLVAEMLDLSRAEQIEINYSDEVTNVNEVFNQVNNDFKMIHPEFTFIVDNDTYNDVSVQIYRNHLEQILVILIDNAIKYSKDRKEIHTSISSTDSTVNIAVQDFGEGIASDDVAKVFNRFYRVDKARSRDKGGNGLGLSIAQRLVEAYHGDISIESSLGYGSIFQIKFPILRSGIQADEADSNDGDHQ